MLNPILKKTSYISAALLFGFIMLASAWAPAYSDPMDASQLLQEAKTSAAQLRRDASQMEAYTRSQVTWQAAATKINQVKNHINKLGQLVSNMGSARAEAKPWQQDAIDRITPLLREMADNTRAIIDHLNDRKQTWHPEYKDLVKSNAELSVDLSKLVSDYIDYGNAKSRAQELGSKLGVSVS